MPDCLLCLAHRQNYRSFSWFRQIVGKRLSQQPYTVLENEASEGRLTLRSHIYGAAATRILYIDISSEIDADQNPPRVTQRADVLQRFVST